MSFFGPHKTHQRVFAYQQWAENTMIPVDDIENAEFVRKQWENKNAVEQIVRKRIDKLNLDEESLERVKTLVFMRLNAARDAKDKKTIATLTEIQEAMR